jgi:hypothetical protein
MARNGAAADETNQWGFDVSLYGLAAGMSGDITVKGIPADVDVSFGDVLQDLKFGAMGAVRVSHDRWSLLADVIYLNLGASKGPVDADADQWMVEPILGYRLCPGLEALAGVRYNNLHAEIRGTGPLGGFHASDTEDWWDPIVGAHLRLPFAKKFSCNVRGDIGGFGVGSDLSWQAYPYVNWQFSRRGSLQAGYRWFSNDYENGSGASEFKYDVLAHGPQLGFTLSF